MKEESLYGMRVYIDEERVITPHHEIIISADGVHQCLQCGQWVKGSIWALASLDCAADNESESEVKEDGPV